jgi:hypothetical protein
MLIIFSGSLTSIALEASHQKNRIRLFISGMLATMIRLTWIKEKGKKYQIGGMAEWLKAAVLKTANRKVRGFESYSLRQEFQPNYSER